ncbi:MAG: GreA/GreB family elongation factor [Chloroflexi bacterium]|nr:GreA/GreB family elongation factor [Chloroflexota bacterium]HLG51967.1 GreA/GreB family elongation factor [Chloroflexota bacterium]
MSGQLDARESHPITAFGRRQLEAELVRLDQRLEELKGLLEDARADRTADDDESAATLALLDEYSRVLARRAEVQALLATEPVSPPPASTDTVSIGTVVRLREDDGTESSYILVGPAEASPRDRRISIASPLGRALLGRRVGERATVEAPDGTWQATIISIEPAI